MTILLAITMTLFYVTEAPAAYLVISDIRQKRNYFFPYL